jgi:hypothetical protein
MGAATKKLRRKTKKRSRPADGRGGTFEILERLLLRKVSIRIRGELQRVPEMAAVVLQLEQKALAGEGKAWRALLKYLGYAKTRAGKAIRVRFEESDYTKAIAKSVSGVKDG